MSTILRSQFVTSSSGGNYVSNTNYSTSLSCEKKIPWDKKFRNPSRVINTNFAFNYFPGLNPSIMGENEHNISI